MEPQSQKPLCNGIQSDSSIESEVSSIDGSDTSLQMLGRFSDVAMLAADWFWEMGKDLRFTYQSERFETVTGIRISDVIGKTREQAFVGLIDDSAKWQKLGESLLQKNDYSMVWALRLKDGSTRILRTNGKPFYDDQGEFQGYRGVGSDITESVRINEALEASEARFRDFAETAADWFWEQDTNLRYTYVTEAFVGKKYNIDRDMIGKTREELFPDIDFNTPNWQHLLAKQAAQEPFHDFEYEFQPDDNDPTYIRISGKPFYDNNGVYQGYRGSANDITDAYRLSQQLSYQAAHDPLTGLVNRREFEKRLSEALREYREDQSEHALCYIDLDQFKVVNDNCGHEGGDQLLLQITSILKHQVRANDIVARLGGDEFGVLLKNCPLSKSSLIAEKIRLAVDENRYINNGKAIRVGCSIGLIPLNSESQESSDVMREADAACYAAKDGGRNRVHIYHEDNPEVYQRHQEMQSIVEINRAFDDNRFLLYRQTILNIQSENTPDADFFEVLVRMKSASGELVSPGAFLPVAERYNLITQLDGWVVKTAVKWLCQEQAYGRSTACSINLSGMSIASEKFLDFIIKTLDISGVEASRICFEVTETAAISNIDIAMHFIKKLKEKGCFFALDDFGSGFSSFAYLKTLPVDFLKIDGFFVRDILHDPINFELVKSINDIGHVTGKKTIAEFVEDAETMEALKGIGIDYAQGYAIDRPCPVWE